MQRTQIYLPKTQLARVKAIARKRDMTASAVVRFLLEKSLTWTDQKKKKRPIQKNFFYTDTKALLKKLEKIGEKGPADLAQNMDQYLYGGR